MRIVTSLVAGVRGAENGTADIYQKGTSARATIYADHDGTVHSDNGNQLSLDSNGGFVVYVNEYVDVVVKDSTGTTVRTFTEGDTANNVEYRGQSFTGTNPDTGATGTGSNFPVALQTIFDLWYTNAGGSSAVSGSGIDWKVTVDGATKTLAAWLGVVGGNIIFNVKDPTYGATGDGSTDDYAAIAAAIAAADDAGGVVVFPPGDYYVETGISLTDTVQLIGSGSGITSLSMNHASNALLTVPAHTGTCRVSGFTLDAAQSNSAAVVTVNGAQPEVIISDCVIGGANNDATTLVDGAAADQKVRFERCRFNVTAETQDAIDCDNHTAGSWQLEACRFALPATYNPTNAVVYGALCELRDCYFETGTCTSGTFSVYKSDSTTLSAIITGCHFEDSGGATVTCMELGTYVAASQFYEGDNRVPSYSDSNTTAYSYTIGAAGAQVLLKTRENRVQHVSESGTSMTVSTDQFGTIVVTHTNAGSGITISGTAVPEGATGTVVVYRTGAGTQSAVLDNESTTVDGFKTGIVGAATLSNSAALCWFYTGAYLNGTGCLFIGADAQPLAGLP